MPKVVCIGAGSVVFTKNLTRDILSWPELQASTLTYVDFDTERLDLATVDARPRPARLGAAARRAQPHER